MKVTSAWLKKMRKAFKVGDLVTWGNGFVYERVLEVRNEGLMVESEGKPYFVRWNGDARATKTVEVGREIRKK